jgi:hypothetical protein
MTGLDEEEESGYGTKERKGAADRGDSGGEKELWSGWMRGE